MGVVVTNDMFINVYINELPIQIRQLHAMNALIQYIYIYKAPTTTGGLSTLAKELLVATRLMQSSSNELGTSVSDRKI